MRRIAPEARACDMLLFGRNADVSSPLPLKYGVDMDADMVYNIVIGITFNGCRLFSGARMSGGYIDFTLTDEAIFELAAPYMGIPLTLPEAPFEHGRNLCSVRARLIWAAKTGGSFFYPRDALLRRAFLCCLFADTEGSRQRAAVLADEALEKSRRARFTGGETLSGGAAHVMAAALGKNEIDKIP